MEKTIYKGTNRLLLGLCLAVCTYWLFSASAGIYAINIAQDLHVQPSDLSMPISFAGLFSGAFIVAAGNFADRFGRKLLTVVGLVLSAIGSVIIIFAPNLLFFSIARIFQGVSAALIMPSTLSLIKMYYAGDGQARAVSFWSISSWGSSGLTNLFGGFVATFFGWRIIFILNICVSLLSFWLISATPESKNTAEQSGGIDWFGLVTLVCALFCLNILTSNFQAWGLTSPLTVGLFAAFVVSLLLFFFKETRKGKAILLDLSLFRNRMFSVCVLTNFLINTLVGSVYIYLIAIQTGFHYTPMQAGLLTLGNLFGIVLTIRIGEKVYKKLGARKPMLIGTIIAPLGVSFLTFTFLPQPVYLALSVIGLAIMGVGLGFYATPSTDTAISALPPEHAGMGSGIFKMASTLGGSFGIVIASVLYTASSGSLPVTLGCLLIAPITAFIIIFFFAHPAAKATAATAK